MREVISFLRKNFFKGLNVCTTVAEDMLFPKYCINCGRMLPVMQKLCVCDRCTEAVKKMVSVYDDERIGCKQIVSALKYDGKIRDAMLKFKFKNIKYLGYTFGKLLAETVKDRDFINKDTVITAVPIHISRDREYNQSEVVARHMCRELGIDYTDGVLFRIRPIKRLSSMELGDKEFFIKDSYMLNPCVNLCGKTVVIIDDVFTTGTTLRVVSREMKKYGAKEVYALTACYSKIQ